MDTLIRQELPSSGGEDAPWQRRLAARGWALIDGVGTRAGTESRLRRLGPLRAQYGGAMHHEVRFRPGFDDLQYSQSANAITPHTEAPGLDPPPRYLALHCHRQARCGGGHTVLADGYRFFESLPDSLRAEAMRRPIRFDLAAPDGIPARAAPLWTEGPAGTAILRYSHNVMRDGRLEGPVRDHDDLDGLDPFHRELCRRGVAFSRDHGTRVLAADDALLVFDNWRMLHSRERYRDRRRHLTRYWVG